MIDFDGDLRLHPAFGTRLGVARLKRFVGVSRDGAKTWDWNWIMDWTRA